MREKKITIGREKTLRDEIRFRDDLNNKMVEKNCTVNYSSIYIDKAFKTWKCIDCDMDLICEGCRDCHKDHAPSLRETSLNAMNDQLCGCLRAQHKVTEKKLEGKITKEKFCPLSKTEVDGIYSSLFYQKSANPNEVMCFNCYENCLFTVQKKEYKACTADVGLLKCGCAKDKGHRGSLYGEKILNYFNPDKQNTLVGRLSFKLLNDDSIAKNGFYVLNALNRKIFNSIAFSFKNNNFTLSLNTKSEEKQKIQMKKFIKCLKTLKALGKDISSNPDMSNNYSFNNTLSILKVKDIKGRVDFLIYLQMFYLRVFRYIHLPKAQDMHYHSANISSFHRILLSKSVEASEATSHIAKPTSFVEVLSLFDYLNPIIGNALDPKDVLPEYIKLLHYLIDMGKNDMSNYKEHIEKFVSVLIEGIKKASVIKSSLNKKIGRLFERMMYYFNDYLIYYKIFKKTLGVGKDNTKEELHYSFENTKSNLAYLQLIFNKNTEVVDITYDFNIIIDHLSHNSASNDDFIESLEQISKSNIPLDQSLIHLLSVDCFEYIKNQSLQQEQEKMKLQMKVIEELIENAIINPEGVKSESIFDEIQKLKNLLQNCLKDLMHKQSFQIFFFASRLFSRLTIAFNSLRHIKSDAKGQKKHSENTYRDIFFSFILLLCDDNPFLSVLFFNHHRNQNNKCPYLYLKSIETLSLYSTLLTTLNKFDYKINTEIFTEAFGMLVNKIIQDKKALKANEFALLISTAKLIMNVSNAKSYHISNQGLLTQINILALHYIIDKENYEAILGKPINSFTTDHVSLLKSYFSFINELNNDTFEIMKYAFDNSLIAHITTKINEPVEISKKSVCLSLMRAELMLFYSKYNFSSLYTNREDSLLDYENIQVSMATIKPLFDYVESFAKGLHTDLNEMELMSCLIKGVAMPSILLIWKINSFGVLDGVAKYIIYHLTFWLLSCFNYAFDIINKKNKDGSMRIKTELIKEYFIENCDIEKMALAVQNEYEEIKQEDFPCLNNDICIQKVLKVMNSLKFFKETQQLMKANQLEYSNEEGEDNKDTNEDGVNKLKDHRVLGQIKHQIAKYTKLKQEGTVLNELFNESNAELIETTIAGSLLINLLSITETRVYEKEAINLLNLFDMAKTRYLSVITPYFHGNPKFWQELILTNTSSSAIIELFTTKAIKFFAQFVYADYVRLLVTDSPYYTLLIESFEFLRLLCEDHNPYFQTILIQNGKFFSSKYDFINLVFDMFLEITKHVRHFTMQETMIYPLQAKSLNKGIDNAKESKDNGKPNHNPDDYVLQEDKEKGIELLDKQNDKVSGAYNLFKYFTKENYFNRLSDKLCDFQIEIIQGTKIENLTFIAENGGFQQLLKVYSDFLDENSTEDTEYAKLCENYLKFLNCYIEELRIYLHCDLSPSFSLILQNINPKKYIDFGEKSFYKLIFNKIKDKDVREKITISIIKQNIREKNSIKFFDSIKETIEDIKANIYLYYDDITANPFFMNSFYVLLFITRIKDYQNDIYGQYEQILNSLISSSNEERYAGFYYEVCSFLLLDNEVMYTLNFDQSQRETEKYIALFKEILNANPNKALRDNFNKAMLSVPEPDSKKKTNRLKIYSFAEKDSLLLKDKDFKLFDKVAVHDDYYTKLSGILNHYKEYSITIDMRKLLLDPNPNFINRFNEMNYGALEIINCILCLITAVLLVIKSPGSIFEPILLYFEITHLMLLFILMSIFFIGNSYKIKRFSESDNHRMEILGIAWDIQILPFEWTFIWGLLGLRFDFLLSLQLFVIFKISETMKSALLSIQTRIKQFAATGFLLIILMFLYSALTMYFFAQKSDLTYWCESYWECFLYMMNNGIRGGGLGFDQKTIDQPGYWKEFIYSWIFYFLIILIIMNIINGIIVDTFQALREQNNVIETSRKDICFICQLERSQFEHKELDFEFHTSVEHNVMNYFRYLFKLNRNDPHDLNAVDFQVKNSIKAGRVDFFPLDRANGFEEEEEEEKNEEEEEGNNEKPQTATPIELPKISL